MAGKKLNKTSAATTALLLEQDNKPAKNDRSISNSYVQETTNSKKKERRKKRAAAVMESNTELEIKAPDEHVIDDPTMERELNGPDNILEDLTMEEKLASLEFKEKVNVEDDPASSVKLPSADSVHVLLKQALRADDHSMLTDCLHNMDSKVISNSISLLAPADVLKLLRSLTLMTQSRGAALVCVLPWLRCLLSQQASSIISQGTSLQLLNSLYQLVDARVSTLKSSRALLTTLDFLFPGIPDDEDDEEEVVAPIVYEDKDTDDDDDEVSDTTNTDDEGKELGDVIDAQFVDGSDIMSD